MLFLALISCKTVPVQNEEKEADSHYKMGIAYLSEGNIQPAFVEFQKTLQLNPDNKDALINLGYVYLQFEEYEKAKGLFLRAVSIDPQFADAYTYLGITYIKMRHWNEAIEPLKKALSNVLYKSPGKGFYYLGMAYYRMGLFDNAIDAFKDSIKRSPSTPQAYYGLSLAYNKTGRYGDAAAMIERAIEIDPSFNSDKAKFITEMKQNLLTSKGEDETDTKDYLEIIKY
ncbi:MAG TPA: tetratricopeptide repeat protein [Dissulfurispiraceae bacterium]|nr:tetratricopeptide repeat protein [Dissulfurispiraceae bacterium]